MNILFTSTGRRGYLVGYFKEIMKDGEKVYAANSRLSPGLYYADEKIISPPIFDDGYIPFLSEVCERNGISAIIPLFDLDALKLSEYKQYFAEKGIAVVVSENDVVRLCLDKYDLIQYLNTKQFVVPHTYNKLEEVKEAINSGIIRYPLMIKPRCGMGSIGNFKACNGDELTVLFKKCAESIEDSYLSLYAGGTTDESVIVQEFLEGTEFGIDILCDLEGNYVHSVVKRKIGMRAGETDEAIVVENEELTKLSQYLASCLKFSGNTDVDVIFSKDKYYIIDVNTRFGGGYPFTHASGINYPKALISWLRGEKAPDDCFIGRMGIRVYKDINIVCGDC